MIKIDHLTKSFRRQVVLSDVSLTLPASSITAIIGPNGSGKTTLMKSIIGLVRPDKGAITLNGVSTLNGPAARANIGYMSQVARYPENLTATELISMVRGLRRNRQADCAEELTDLFELRPHLSKQMRMLSGGTRQKVGAVLAMMYSPAALLLDEPTAGLDPIATDRFKQRVINARKLGVTVVVTSHVLAEIQEIADQLVYLNEGRVAYQGPIDQLLQSTGEQALSRAVPVLMHTLLGEDS